MKSPWPRAAFALTLWFCALTMQSIGLLHGIVHVHHGHAHLAAPAVVGEGARLDADAQVASTSVPHAHGWLQSLFADHFEGSAGCTLFDQLTHADLLHELPMLALTFAAPSLPEAVHAAWHHATQVTGFLARAPPAIG